jgi:DNA-binding GntR family transcriptional regulator
MPRHATVPADGVLRASVHDELRRRFVTGKVMPGTSLSTRGLALELGVSQMPVREALGRMAAEGAVEIRSKRRIVVPSMTEARFSDLLRCRELLEPEAAASAVGHFDAARLRRLRIVDDEIGDALRDGDVGAYMERNYEFHFLIYRAQPRQTLLQLIETLWLQFGPYMRVVYGRFGTSRLEDQHAKAIEAIRERDPQRLKRAMLTDIRDGMSLIEKNGFEGGG